MTKPESETHVRAILGAVPAGVDSAAYTVFIKGTTRPQDFSCAGTRDRLGNVKTYVHPPDIPEKTMDEPATHEIPAA